jgi:hypothetical protein
VCPGAMYAACCSGPLGGMVVVSDISRFLAGIRRQKSEDRSQKTEDRRNGTSFRRTPALLTREARPSCIISVTARMLLTSVS